MPALDSLLSDEQIAQLVNYIRASFGNRFADTISAAEIGALRAQPQRNR